jgi:Ran-binding protein 3
MASKEEKAIDGDNEGPVREKLKQTSIDTLPKNGATTTENGNAQGNTESTESPSEAKRVEGISTNDMEADDKEQPRGRHTRKRSYDDLIDISEQGSGHQIDHSDTVMAESKRKRSSEARSQERPISGKEDAGIDSFPAGVKSDSDKFMGDLKEPHMEEARAKAVTPDRDEIMGIDRVLSPKKKRSRDQFDKDLVEAPAESTAIQSSRSSGESERDVTSTGRASRRSNREGPEKKRPRDVSKDAFEKKEVEEDSVRRNCYNAWIILIDY